MDNVQTSDHIIQHPRLGLIRGLRYSDSVMSFLGIQYATLGDRFSRAQLVQPSPLMGEAVYNGVLDATKHGFVREVQYRPHQLIKS